MVVARMHVCSYLVGRFRLEFFEYLLRLGLFSKGCHIDRGGEWRRQQKATKTWSWLGDWYIQQLSRRVCGGLGLGRSMLGSQ